MGAFGLVDGKEVLHLGHDQIERPGLVAARGLDRVAVHRVAGPDHVAPFPLGGAHQRREVVEDLVGAEAGDQGQPACLVLRIEHLDQLEQAVDRGRGTAFQADRVPDAAEELDMGMIELARAVADPDHVAGGVVPLAGGGIDARHRLLIAEQQRLVAGVEIGRAHLRMGLRIDADGAHELQRLGDALGDLLIAMRLRAVLDEAEHPAMRVVEVGVAARGEGAQQVQRRGRLSVGLELPARIGYAGLGREGDVVDDVALVARQLDVADLLVRRRARLGELPGDAPDLHDGRAAGEGQHDRHLQEQPEEIPDVVGGVLREALRTITALQEEGLAGRDLAQRPFELARLPCKNERRKAGELLLDRLQGCLVRIIRNLLGGPGPPALWRPPLGHGTTCS